ncbi:2765_t:CDS:1, partial [Racocetra fulgida]
TKNLTPIAYECASGIDNDLNKLLIENKYRLPWIPYDEFNIVKMIGKGGFAIVYAANWFDKS